MPKWNAGFRDIYLAVSPIEPAFSIGVENHFHFQGKLMAHFLPLERKNVALSAGGGFRWACPGAN